MELLETQDPEKKRLIETSDRHKHELEKEVKQLSDKTERVVKNALIIGGTLAVTYLIVSSLNSSKKSKKKSKAKKAYDETEDEDSPLEKVSASASPPSFMSQIGDRIATQAIAILISMAKDKLSDYLSNRKQNHENS